MRKPWRILHVITRLDKGGSAENTLLTTLGTDPERFETHIVCGVSDNPPSVLEEEALNRGNKIFRLAHFGRPIAPLKDARSLWQIYRLIRKNRYDLVHTHTSKGGFLGRLAAKLAGVPRVVHTPHGHVFQGYFSPLLTRVFIAIEKICMQWTDVLITLTESGKKQHLDVGIGPAERICAVPSGISLRPYFEESTDKASVRERLGIPAGAFVCGTVARLVEVKNHELIIKAAARAASSAPDLCFVFAGDGPLRSVLEEQVAATGLTTRFIFLGWQQNVPQILRSFDVFAMPSKNEGMGRAFVEAQAAGLPVIGSRVGGVPDVVDEGRTGLLVSPEDPSELAAALLELYKNREKIRTMSEQARRWVHPQFSAEVMVAKIQTIYSSLLDP